MDPRRLSCRLNGRSSVTTTALLASPSSKVRRAAPSRAPARWSPSSQIGASSRIGVVGKEGPVEVWLIENYEIVMQIIYSSH